VTPDEFEVFAVIAQVLFLDWFRSAIAALMRDMPIMAGTVQANPQIRTAPDAAFAPPRLA
jgi:hypothetical protein